MIDKNNDLEFLRDKFERDGLQVPDSLSADAMRQKLEAAGAPEHAKADAPSLTVTTGSSDQAPRKKRWTRPLIAAAACAALVIGLIPAMHSILPEHPDDSTLISEESGSTTVSSGDASDLITFDSYKDLDREMKNLLASESSKTDSDIMVYESSDMADADIAAEDSPAFATGSAAEAKESGSASTNAALGSDAPQHSETYTQVEGIDEADIVKTDGNYIYHLSSVENQIIITKVNNGKTKRISAVSGSKAHTYIHDIYVLGDQLIVIGADREGPVTGIYRNNSVDSTTVSVYDISDRTDPKLQNSYSQSGSLLSSRLIGNHVCLVTNEYLYSYEKNRSLPYVSFGEGKAEKLPIADICSFPEISSPAYTVVGMIDLASDKTFRDTVRTKAVLGGSDEIYCNGENLYITATLNRASPYVIGSREAYVPDMEAWDWQTQILKVSLAKGKVKYERSAIVDGNVNDQFSMDESNGTFKIATTSVEDGADVNNLFILDKKLNGLGACIGFARDEHIEAVRYIKDKAYVITYEQTDPLFIIDLSDPSDPVIEGHVKISGFSTLLVPADNDHLLGLGFSTETTEFGEATDGVKLALFDISDPSEPKVADSESFPHMYSTVQYDHKALLVGPNADYYAIPYEKEPDSWYEEEPVEIWDDAEEGDSEQIDAPEDEPSYGILVFSAKGGGLRMLQDLKADENVSRCIYIGDYIYGICEDDSIEGFRMK